MFNNRPLPCKLKYLWSVNELQLTEVVQHRLPFGGLKMYRNVWDPELLVARLNYTKFLNYKNGLVKYKSCQS